MENHHDIAIRQIQHYMYCPHRWGLLEIDNAWEENYYVVKANLLHDRVHSNAEYKQGKKKIYTSVPIWDEDYGIYGMTDCLEETNGKYTLVEYKPTMPKKDDFRPEDALQVFAQKVCVDKIFHCDCEATIYYSDKKKRIRLPFKKDEQYDRYKQMLETALHEIRDLREHRTIPDIKKGQNCSGCSMKDLCLPGAVKKKNDIKNYIINFSSEEV